MDLNTLEKIKDFCHGFKNPVVLFDEKDRIVYCNKPNFVTSKSDIQIIAENEKPRREQNILALVNGSKYSVRVSMHGELYMYEFFSYSDLFDMADKSDIYEKILPFINSFEHNISVMWGCFSSLKKKLEEEERFDDIKQLADIQKSAMYLNASGKNIFEYANMFYPKASVSRIDTYALVEGIVNRCNEMLADCGRRIDFIAQKDDYFIKANQRHCISALINALQNALLYSPVDCCPTITLTRTILTDNPYAVLQVTNKCKTRAENGEKLPDLDFACQRIGCGIPIIKRFAQEADGVFDMEERNGSMIVTLKIPIIVNKNKSELVLEQSEYAYYDTGIPDIIDLKMFEVADFFGKN